MNTNTWMELPDHKLPFDFTQELTDHWMLVTAGDSGGLGTMTISWGGNGYLWNKDVIFIVVRESRNTLTYLKSHPTFSLTLFDESYHENLFFCGRNSGRDVDKISHCGFTPRFEGTEGTPYFEEAHTAVICRQLYRSIIEKEHFLEGPPLALWETWYNTGVHTNDRHHLIIASVEKILTKGSSNYGKK